MNYELLKADFPPEALSADKSRGFELTSLKAAYVIERLNDVFGLVGTGWRYAHADFVIDDNDGKRELTTEVALQYAVPPQQDRNAGTGRVMWQNGAWVFDGDYGWSEPVFAPGGNQIHAKSPVRMTDARKSALTNGLSKAASMLGVGHLVFKGQGDMMGTVEEKPNTKTATEYIVFDNFMANPDAVYVQLGDAVVKIGDIQGNDELDKLVDAGGLAGTCAAFARIAHIPREKAVATRWHTVAERPAGVAYASGLKYYMHARGVNVKELMQELQITEPTVYDMQHLWGFCKLLETMDYAAALAATKGLRA